MPTYWPMAVPGEGRTLPRRETCGSQTGSKRGAVTQLARGSPFRGRDTFYEGSWLCLKVFVCKKCDLGYSWRCDLGLSGWDVDHGPCDQVSSVFPEVMITHCPAGRVESAPQPSPMGAHAHPWQCLCLQTSCLLWISCSPGVRYFPLLKLLSELLLVPSEMLGCSGTRCGCGHLLNVGCGHLLP